MSSKYDPLTKHLEVLTAGVWNARFREVELVLGFTLPKSSRTHAAWWSNTGQPHSRTWTDAGWQIEALNLPEESLRFRRTQATGAIVQSLSSQATDVRRPNEDAVPPARSSGLAWIDEVMSQLAISRPVFHSEADFQHSLAWTLREAGATQIRLERRYESLGGYLDLHATLKGRQVAFELKHWTRALNAVVAGEEFRVRNQSAQDICRYDFVKDVTRLERLVEAGDARIGYAIALTNDRGYWKRGRDGTVDEAFRLYEGRVLEGNLSWADHAGPGTTKNREVALALENRYPLVWQPYSHLDGSTCAEFRYLALEVSTGDQPAPRFT